MSILKNLQHKIIGYTIYVRYSFCQEDLKKMSCWNGLHLNSTKIVKFFGRHFLEGFFFQNFEVPATPHPPCIRVGKWSCLGWGLYFLSSFCAIKVTVVFDLTVWPYSYNLDRNLPSEIFIWNWEFYSLLLNIRFLHGNKLETIADGTFTQFNKLSRW